MSPRSLTRLFIVLAVAIAAGSVWLLGHTQRDAVTSSFRQSEAAQELLTAAIDQETGLRGYLNTGRADFLQPYITGERRFDELAAELRRTTPDGDTEAHTLLVRSVELNRDWSSRADAAIALRRAGQHSLPVTEAVVRKALTDRFRATNARLLEHLRRQRAARLDRIGLFSVLLIVGISAVFALAGWITFGRRAEARQRQRQAEHVQREQQLAFAHALQFTDAEQDAHALVKRHLEGSMDDVRVTVLQRNNSADRLEAVTSILPDGPIAAQLVDADPRSCLAVRQGSEFRGGEPDQLLECQICGKSSRELATCTPLLVQGEVIGSVLVEHNAPLGETERQYVTETVTQAAPVVANMRNLAIAELRAATDALTGLPNRRAIQDTLRRMVAQANRSEQPLAAVALDLDHFKKINDRFGHDKGDDVLAAAAQVLKGTLRESDFVGRQGGEEFIVLLPDTGLEGALVAAENLRRAIARIEIEGVDQPITASFGVAVFPGDAGDPDTLFRHADRALYVAKDHGRNRVEAWAASAALPETAA